MIGICRPTGVALWVCVAVQLALGCSLRGAAPLPATPTVSRPNLIWIIADDLGWGDLGCYGQRKVRTPHLDRLAGEGMRFTQCYVASPDNLRARAALLCGRHPERMDLAIKGPPVIEPEFATIGQALQGAGYLTGYLGKWGLGRAGHFSVPERKGFTEWLGFMDAREAGVMYPEFVWRSDPVAKFHGQFPLALNRNGGAAMFNNDLLLRASTNFVRIHFPNQFNRHTPFLLVLSPALPQADESPVLATNALRVVPTTLPYSGEPWPEAEKQKAAAIARLDQMVGELMTTLRHHGQQANTLTFFTSDGGPFKGRGCDPGRLNSSGGLRGHKGQLWEGGLRVPLLAHWPGKISAGRTNEMMCSQVDLLPTVLELAGVPRPKGLDGISFAPALLGRELTNRHSRLVWFAGTDAGVRAGNWKGVKTAGGAWELFDLAANPAEVAGRTLAEPGRMAEFERLLREFQARAADGPER